MQVFSWNVSTEAWSPINHWHRITTLIHSIHSQLSAPSPWLAAGVPCVWSAVPPLLHHQPHRPRRWSRDRLMHGDLRVNGTNFVCQGVWKSTCKSKAVGCHYSFIAFVFQDFFGFKKSKHSKIIQNPKLSSVFVCHVHEDEWIGMFQNSLNLETAVSCLAASVLTMYTAPRPWRICWSLFASWFLACSTWSTQIQKLRSTNEVQKPRWVASIPTFRLTNTAAGKWYLGGTRHKVWS